MLLQSSPFLSPTLSKMFEDNFLLTMTEEKDLTNPYYSFTNNTLSLHFDSSFETNKRAKSMNYRPLSFDFVKEWNALHHTFPSFSKKDPLLKALAIKRGGPFTLLDATCGTGKDSLLFLKLGAKLLSFERSSLMAPLLWDAHRRALEHPELGPLLEQNLTLQFKDAQTLDLEELPFRPDVIFLDPMFPPKKKKALPKKEMVLFSNLIGKDEDQENLLHWALSLAKKRVVLKRPLWAPTLTPEPTLSFKGTKIRFDTYLL